MLKHTFYFGVFQGEDVHDNQITGHTSAQRVGRLRHVSVVNLGVLEGTFVFIFLIAEREFIVSGFIGDSFSDAANSDPPCGWVLEVNKGRHQVVPIESFTTHQVVYQENSGKRTLFEFRKHT